MDKVTKRVQYLYDDTMIIAADVLDPESHYTIGFCKHPRNVDKLLGVLRRIADDHRSATLAMYQFEFYRTNQGEFGGPMARFGAQMCSPAAWWLTYGGSVPELQKYTLRIVSHCVSSSGCERNWSTFALVHTKSRNRLSYEKLHKLVPVHYNLKLRIQQSETNCEEKEVDPCELMLNLTLFDETNPIMDWMNNSRSEAGPILDVGGGPSPIINRMRNVSHRKRKLVKISSLVEREKCKSGERKTSDVGGGFFGK